MNIFIIIAYYFCKLFLKTGNRQKIELFKQLFDIKNTLFRQRFVLMRFVILNDIKNI